MIFASVGTQLAFPRMIGMLRELIAVHDYRFIAQTNEPEEHVQLVGRLDGRTKMAPDEYEAVTDECSVMISHAGIGSIISASNHGKPIIMVPRRHALGEHRNDHQMETARRFEGRPGIYIAESAEEISALLSSSLVPCGGASVSTSLVQGLNDFIKGSSRG